MPSTITNGNIFNGQSGIFGSIGDGLAIGHSLEIFGNDSSVELNCFNPDAVDLQVEFAPIGSNIWSPVGEISTVTRIYYAIWSDGFSYRIRQLTASATQVVIFVRNNVNLFIPATSAGFDSTENDLITLDRIYTLPPLP